MGNSSQLIANEPERADIMEIIKTSAKPMKLSEIAAAAGKKLTTVYKLVSGLVQSQHVEKNKYGVYKLPDSEEQEVDEGNETDKIAGCIANIIPNDNLEKNNLSLIKLSS